MRAEQQRLAKPNGRQYHRSLSSIVWSSLLCWFVIQVNVQTELLWLCLGVTSEHFDALTRVPVCVHEGASSVVMASPLVSFTLR